MLCGCPVQAVGSPPMQKERKALSLSGGILGYTPLKKKRQGPQVKFVS